MSALPKGLMTALLEQDEMSEKIESITKKIGDKYKAETGHLDINAESSELIARYGKLFHVVGQEMDRKINKLVSEVSEAVAFILPLPDSCYDCLYADLVIRVKTALEAMDVVNKRSEVAGKACGCSEVKI